MDKIKVAVRDFWYYLAPAFTLLIFYIAKDKLNAPILYFTHVIYIFDAHYYYLSWGTAMICIGTAVLIISIDSNMKQITKKTLFETEKHKISNLFSSPKSICLEVPCGDMTIHVNLPQVSLNSNPVTDSEKIIYLYNKIDELTNLINKSSTDNSDRIEVLNNNINARINGIVADDILPMKDNLHNISVGGYKLQLFSVLFIVIGSILIALA